MRRASGFSLIEIAVVLFIVGIVLTATITALNSLSIGAREKSTRTKQEAIKSALSTFLVRNNRLPCPADIKIATGGLQNGVEAATPGTCTEVNLGGVNSSGAAPNVVKTGAIPWASLGLPEEASLDASGNRFTYQVMANATNLNADTVSGMLGAISIHSAGLGVAGAAPAGNQINDCSVAPSTYNPCGAVAVIVSHGVNGFGAYTTAGQQVPIPGTVIGNDERENANGDNRFVIKSYSDIDTNPYDDIVLAITAGDFLTPLAASGTLKDYQATLNAKMAVIKGAIIANAYTAGGGGGGALRNYLFPGAVPLPASQLNDPWGTAIVYAVPTPNVNCNTVPTTNTVFTLTSLGPDKLVNTADDFKITVTVADIVAIIALAGCNA